jgi:hypothetical protein
MKVFRKLWEGWRVFALWLGKIQTAILLSLVYHLTIGPIGLIGRVLRKDLLGLRRVDGDSYWSAVSHVTGTMEQAAKQF